MMVSVHIPSELIKKHKFDSDSMLILSTSDRLSFIICNRYYSNVAIITLNSNYPEYQYHCPSPNFCLNRCV